MQRLGPVLGSIGADPREVRRIFIDEAMVSVGGTPAWIWVAFEPDLRATLDFHAARAGTQSMPICSSGGSCISAAGSPSTRTARDGARTPAGGRAPSTEHIVYDRPPRNLMERMVQYLKEGTEAFDDLFPAMKSRLASGRAFERMHNWLSAFMSMHDFVFENGGLGRPPLEWKEEMPPWLDGLRPIFSLG